MDGKGECVPFGMLFEESPHQPERATSPAYDENADLSYVDYEGQRVPWVRLPEFVRAPTATNSEIAVADPASEHRRTLFSLALADTETVTKMSAEITDRD